MRHDHFINIAPLSRDERREEPLFIVFRAFSDFVWIIHISAENDFDRALGTHHRDLRGRPGIIHIATQMFRRHHIIGATKGFTRNDCDKRHACFTISEE